MITSSDSEYKATKRIKQGKAHLVAPFDELARWISSAWHGTVLNVIYDCRNSLHAPRLQVILEHQADVAKFRKGLNFDEAKQDAIKSKFLEIIGRDRNVRFQVDGLFVVFSAFAPLALQEADSRISDRELKDLKVRLGNPDLWEISRCFGNVTFFFFTEEQVKRYEAAGLRTAYAMRYFALLKPHDEFGYLEEKDYRVAFDSKQNLDENFQSNWFYYYR